MTERSRQAHAVLFPVLETLEIDDPLARFLDRGGRSLLFGETGPEYEAGRMSASRLAIETAEAWQRGVEAARSRAGGSLILAADADIAAVHRLEGVAGRLPSREAAAGLAEPELERVCEAMARRVRETGINLVLSPTADVLTGPNPWLRGRTLADDAPGTARQVRAYVRGALRAGLATTLKHFPGHPVLDGHPARDPRARVPLALDALRAQWAPFQAGIAAGASAVMMGPASFDAVQPPAAGSLSAALIGLLRDELGFTGLVMTCDLDHPATLGDRSLADTVVAALGAGADLLLVSPRAVPQLETLAQAIVAAVERGVLDAQRLEAAAAKVRGLAERLSR
ncbi:glycoside hydrolase family 3 N-terminal domain-containing protein [Burkholderia gladioli]|uniref:glycoside hydrolase family 3 N-terminal domain-containing protein n=1 Tax=Burkholderia gladioli TaxID=28095 RepID=UPI00164102D4|nr:glycoside hydrolase family 3 N-terminal domain-containing protein [Burkholderia gladioli]